ncbi:MAG: PEP/pyruvate-binding domain-containing protein, partial [Anaerolineae bacterium]|nr:PEP/pyruvate-binding domain-containing protein [Anaerolineae bacterium]
MSRVIQSFGELTAEQQACAGGKGGALARLYQGGYPTPDGFVILPTAFADDGLTGEAWNQTQAYLDRLRGGDCAVPFAVRSSAMGEDSAQASFAGEFETVLNVVTDEEDRQAILAAYHSRRNERVQAYSQAQGLDGSHEIAVIVQRLVDAERAGVLFTAHAVTGRRDQAMISAAWGPGESIVAGLVTPDALVVAKATGRVLSRETANKRVMTVRAGSGTEERPVPDAQRRAPVLSDEQAAELVRWGARIEADYRMPMDIEWAWADGGFFILQARPI